MIVFTDEAFIKNIKARAVEKVAADLRAAYYLETMWHSTLPLALILERVP